LRTKELGKRSLMGKEGISSDTNIFYGNQHWREKEIRGIYVTV
jgi:hypothetical protein